jgi:Nose resistant-to-fluoxetine protein, N-terminal domain
MRKLFDLKFIFIAIFLLFAIAIKNSENFQLRDFDDGVSATSKSKAVSGKHSTKIRYPFRKLEKASIEEIDNDNDSEEDEADENDSEEDTTDYKFAKVRKPTFEVKKRTNLRFSKLAQFRDPKDTDTDDDDDDESDEKISFFARVLNFFKSKPKEEENDESDSEENTDDDSAEVNSSGENKDDDDSNDDEEEKKPLMTEIFDKFKDFLEARNKQNKVSDDDDDDSNDASGDKDDSKEDESSGDDEKEPEVEAKPADSKLKISIKETITTIFNRKPFNLIFDFDDTDEEDEGQVVFEDSEEDEINYQRLLKEEREHMQEHTEQLIKQNSEEEAVKLESVTESPKSEAKKSSPKPKKEKKTKEETHLAQKEFEKLLLNLPSFVPDYSKVKNPECQKQGEVFQRQLRGQRIWALQMMDANAKIPSGLMRGNTNQLGDFESCTKISQKIKISETNSMKMKGKYCLANIDVVAAADQLKLPVHLIQGRNFIRSTINDVSFRFVFDRNSTIIKTLKCLSAKSLFPALLNH